VWIIKEADNEERRRRDYGRWHLKMDDVRVIGAHCVCGKCEYRKLKTLLSTDYNCCRHFAQTRISDVQQNKRIIKTKNLIIKETIGRIRASKMLFIKTQ
jgi:hypothetical protein